MQCGFVVFLFLKIGQGNGMIWCVVVKVSCNFFVITEKSVFLRQERVNQYSCNEEGGCYIPNRRNRN